MPATIEQARRVVADLRQKLSQLEERSVLLSGEREAIAFDAHAGDEKARPPDWGPKWHDRRKRAPCGIRWAGHQELVQG
jgi:hypothetical protein